MGEGRRGEGRKRGEQGQKCIAQEKQFKKNMLFSANLHISLD